MHVNSFSICCVHCEGESVWLWPQGGEAVLQAQALEMLLLQARQPVSQLALLVPFNQVKGPNVEKHLEAHHQQVDEDLAVFLVPAVLPVLVSHLAVKIYALECPNPQIWVVFARSVHRLLE